jgi:hypothetical protein
MNRHRALYLVTENINPVTHTRRIRRFWQRGRKGYDETTWWGLDYAIADLLVHNLPRLMKDSVGTSMQFFEKGDFDPKDNWTVTPEGQKRADARRNEVYGKILDGMKIFVDEGYPFSKKDQAKVDEALQLLSKYFFTMWD